MVAVGVLVIAMLIASRIIPARSAAAALNAKRARVTGLVSVGQTMSDVQAVLVEHGFHLAYDEPFYPTGNPDCWVQMVTIGDTRISMLDSWCYALGVSNPVDRGSPYVMIEASSDGVIYRVE